MRYDLSGFFINLKVYRYLKTVIIMNAKIDLKFLAKDEPKHSIQVNSQENEEIVITQRSENKFFCIVLDIPTAIKFAKTIRTHINLLKNEQ